MTQYMTLSKRRLLGLLLAAFWCSAGLTWLSGPMLALPFGLLAAVALPGLALLVCIQRRLTLDWTNGVLAMGLGLGLLLFTTLADNILLRAGGLMRPLQSMIIWISVTLVLHCLILVGYKFWSAEPLTIRWAIPNRLNRLMLAASALTLTMIIFGAIRLNNGASGGLALAGFIGVGIIMTAQWLLSKKMSDGVILGSLCLLALGVVLSGWLRGRYVAGPDVDIEYQIFQTVKSAGYWSIDFYRNAYNACLSVSLIPVALQSITKLPDLLIFKLLIPGLYSLIVPVVYVITRKFHDKRVALLAAFFFMAQPPFAIWWWIPIRQQVALLFFSLLVLVTVTMSARASTKLLILFFGCAMALSHYSTTYIAIGLFVIAISTGKLVPLLTKSRISVSSLPLTPKLLTVLFLFTFMWYSQLTYGFNGVTSFMTKSVANLSDLFADDVQQNGQTPLDRFNIFSNAGSASLTTIQYQQMQADKAKGMYKHGELYPNASTNDSAIAPYAPYNDRPSAFITLVRNMLKVGGNFLLSVSVLAMVITIWRRKSMSSYNLMQLAAMIFFALILFLPFFSVSYGPDRLYLQLLVMLAGVFGTISNVTRVKGVKHLKLGWLPIAFVGLYFLVLNQVFFQFSQTSQRSLVFGNEGSQYMTYYITDADAAAARWIDNSSQKKEPVFSDGYSEYRLISPASLHSKDNLRTGLQPEAITRSGYVFGSTSNLALETAVDRYQGDIYYRFPKAFLDGNKNIIYVSESSLVYQ